MGNELKHRQNLQLHCQATQQLLILHSELEQSVIRCNHLSELVLHSLLHIILLSFSVSHWNIAGVFDLRHLPQLPGATNDDCTGDFGLNMN